ncbi:MAG: putative signal transducing protein [Sphingomonadales bacterium]
MKELFCTNDPVVISFAEATLKGVNITPMVLDTHTSVLEGSIGILPRRLAVINEDFELAKKTLFEVGLEHEFKT